MSTETFLVRTMSDTVGTDIQRVFTITHEVLPRYGLAPLTFEPLRKIADGPFDLFLIPLIFAKEYQKEHNYAAGMGRIWRADARVKGICFSTTSSKRRIFPRDPAPPHPLRALTDRPVGSTRPGSALERKCQ